MHTAADRLLVLPVIVDYEVQFFSVFDLAWDPWYIQAFKPLCLFCLHVLQYRFRFNRLAARQ